MPLLLLPPHGCKRVSDPNLLSEQAQAPECTMQNARSQSSPSCMISSASRHLSRACSTPCSPSHCKTAAGRQWPAGTALPSRGSTQGWCCLLPRRCSQFRSPWRSVMAVNTATPRSSCSWCWSHSADPAAACGLTAAALRLLGPSWRPEGALPAAGCEPACAEGPSSVVRAWLPSFMTLFMRMHCLAHHWKCSWDTNKSLGG